MTPPPPLKFGQRELFNDSFLSFLRRSNKSQPGPPLGPHSPDSQAQVPISNGHGNGHGRSQRDEGLGEKKRLLQEGLQLIDSTKDMLEMNAYIFGKETTKKFRKEAAKLTKSAPSKSKLTKKPAAEVVNFQQNATALYREVENILREFEHRHEQYGDQAPPQAPHQDQGRSRSESPPPLPRKPPSPKVTFNAEIKPDGSGGRVSRKESSRRGVDLRDPQHGAGMARQDSIKPPSSSRHREKDAEISRSTSQRTPDQDRSKRYERDDRGGDDKYKYRDDTKRSDSRRYTSDQYQSGSRDHSDPYKDRDKDYRPSDSRRYPDTRDYNKDYYQSRSRKYDDRDRDRYRDRDRDYDRDYERTRKDYKDQDYERPRKDDRDRDERKGESSNANPPLRVVHEDAPLSPVHGGASGVPFSPTYLSYGDDSGKRRERERKERERDKYRDKDRERDRDRDRDPDRDRERDRRRDDYDRSYRRDDDYYKSSRGYDKNDKYKSSSRRYDDDYRSGRHKSYRDYPDERDRDRGGDRNRDRDRDRDRDRYREQDRDKNRDRGYERDRERDRDKEQRHPIEDHPLPQLPHDPTPQHEREGDPLGDPLGPESRFQEVFPYQQQLAPPLPPPSEHSHSHSH